MPKVIDKKDFVKGTDKRIGQGNGQRIALELEGDKAHEWYMENGIARHSLNGMRVKKVIVYENNTRPRKSKSGYRSNRVVKVGSLS
jgi:hypothetical protein